MGNRTIIPLATVRKDSSNGNGANSSSNESEWLPSLRKPRVRHQLRSQNRSSEHWGDMLRVVSTGSVVPLIAAPVLGFTVWATVVCVFTLVPTVAFLRTGALIPNSTILVTLLGTVLSLLLAFRVNTAYDRFWEGRKGWSNIHYNIRQLARLIWVFASGNIASKSENSNSSQRTKTGKDSTELIRKTSAMNLLIAYASAVKHELRDEEGTRYADLGPYLQDLQLVAGPRVLLATVNVSPVLRIATALQAFIVDTPIAGAALPAITALTDQLSHFERIRLTPIPAAYTIHLKQSLLLYLFTLPFQLAPSILGWFTIPIQFIIAFVVLGVEVIGERIENPFGVDPNDLAQDDYCDAISDEIAQMMKANPVPDAGIWIPPYSMDLENIEQALLKEHIVTHNSEATAHRFPFFGR
ncbi:hypothetical protein HK100_002524 [Physocladia obscura]|uniref:Uncharacterized protein n=1 Tax=Physocladia obscura TaxID=109957 RepID=A0AAD5XH59_9FUNG|nr:hypothetical protein HK100_002524 [Physocladia obscura]